MAWVLHDDLTGDPIAPGDGGPVYIGFAGDQYEMDLATASQDRIRGELAVVLCRARPIGDAPVVAPPEPEEEEAPAAEEPTTPPAPTNPDPTDAEVRAWAIADGWNLDAGKRVPAVARRAYLAECQPPAAPEPAEDVAPVGSGDDPAPPLPADRGEGRPPAPAVEPAGSGERPRKEQTEVAEDLLERKVPVHTVAKQTGLSLAQVRDIKREAAL